MTKDNETPGTHRSTGDAEEAGYSAQTGKAEKKQFVEPELSIPVDVLEATSFFQGTDSGGGV